MPIDHLLYLISLTVIASVISLCSNANNNCYRQPFPIPNTHFGCPASISLEKIYKLSTPSIFTKNSLPRLRKLISLITQSDKLKTSNNSKMFTLSTYLKIQLAIGNSWSSWLSWRRYRLYIWKGTLAQKKKYQQICKEFCCGYKMIWDCSNNKAKQRKSSQRSRWKYGHSKTISWKYICMCRW